MAGVSVGRFVQILDKACGQSEIVVRIAILGQGKQHIRLRIFLTDRSLLDVYYNQASQKTAFAHVRKEKRTFGADNTNGFWRWHPFENPAIHVRSEAEITFEEVLARVEAALKR